VPDVPGSPKINPVLSASIAWGTQQGGLKTFKTNASILPTRFRARWRSFKATFYAGCAQSFGVRKLAVLAKSTHPISHTFSHSFCP